MNLALNQAIEHGFVPMITPTLVTPQVMGGAGFLDAHSDEVYRLEADDLYLTGTSEVALAGYHTDEILDLSDGARRYAGWSTCYRREAGSYGKDTRGIIRVHQFNKLEMFVYCRPEDAAEEHQAAGHGEGDARQDRGALPHHRHRGRRPRRTGGAQVRLRGVGADAGEVPRADLDLELHDVPGPPAEHPLPDREGTQTAATLNGTLATTRWLVAILENHQQADGSVVVPQALRPYLGLEVLKPA